jgi:phage recombination protein Bet
MEPAAFEATLRGTVCRGNITREEFAAFLLVAKEYRLNPLTREIFAFQAKGGGIQTVVSVDGWSRILNEQPAMDGLDFEDHLEDGKLTAITCRIYRKDRSVPTVVTEYMSECRRPVEVWNKWPARMLRHKALIQCARYAFGFSGLVDQDEYERGATASAPQTSGLAARLNAKSTAGFNPSNVDVIDGEFTDEAVVVETEESVEVVVSDTPVEGDGLGLGDRDATEGMVADATGEDPRYEVTEEGVEALSEPVVDLVAWAGALNLSLGEYESADALRTAWWEHKDALKVESPGLFKQLNKAVVARSLEISGQ